MKDTRNRGLYLGIFFLSMATLSMEISLSRIFSVSLWYHFAFMIVSIAFLGTGASGTFLMIASPSGKINLRDFIWITSFAFSTTLILSYSFAIRISIDPVKLVLEPGQLINIFALYLLLAIPFFFSGLTIAITIFTRPERVHRIYFSDLLGASMGCIFVLFSFPFFGGERVVPICGLLGLFSSFAFSSRWDIKRWTSIIAGVILFIIIFIGPPFFSLKISPYKDLSVALRHPGAKHLGQYWNSISRIDIVDSSAVRFAPGLSLTYLEPLPKQLGLTWDGDKLSALTQYRSENDLAFTDYLPSSLPYYLTDPEKVLIIEPMGGMDILIALHHRAKKIVAVERNPLILKIINDRFHQFTGGIYSEGSDRILLLTGEARSFLSSTKELFDIIVLPITDILGASSTGLGGFGEDYTLTMEGIELLLSRLKPHGFLSISSYLLPPPRKEIKLLCNLLEKAERMNFLHPEMHLIIYRSINTFHILFKKTPLMDKDIKRFKAFCEERLFDLVYYPGIKESETNRFNRFETPIYYLAVLQIIDREKRKGFLNEYLFDIGPVSDERPFFNYIFKFSKIKEVYMSMGKKWQPLLEGGYLIPLILLQAFAASIFLIIIPLIFFKKKNSDKKEIHGKIYLPYLIYFALIGLGFMFVEITLIQKFILFLGEPIYSFSAVLFAVLLSSSLGSRYSEYIGSTGNHSFLWKVPYICICAILLFYIFLFPLIFKPFMGKGLIFRFCISLFLILPIAFFMGMPFPLGMRYLHARFPYIIPWAWCVNSCASVMGPILTISIALSLGFSFNLFVASIFYFLAFILILFQKIKEKNKKIIYFF